RGEIHQEDPMPVRPPGSQERTPPESRDEAAGLRVGPRHPGLDRGPRGAEPILNVGMEEEESAPGREGQVADGRADGARRDPPARTANTPSPPAPATAQGGAAGR